MNDFLKSHPDWKASARRELVSYWLTFAYLALFFGAFATYRRLILAQYGISLFDYGAALIEALILAKVILLGDSIARKKLPDNPRPLAYATLQKAVLFTVWVGVFKLLEQTVRAWVSGRFVPDVISSIHAEGMDVFLARSLVVFFAFIPFFAFKELARVLGEGKLSALFFHQPTPS